MTRLEPDIHTVKSKLAQILQLLVALFGDARDRRVRGDGLDLGENLDRFLAYGAKRLVIQRKSVAV